MNFKRIPVAICSSTSVAAMPPSPQESVKINVFSFTVGGRKCRIRLPRKKRLRSLSVRGRTGEGNTLRHTRCMGVDVGIVQRCSSGHVHRFKAKTVVMGVDSRYYRNISNSLPNNGSRNNRYCDSQAVPVVSFCLDFRYDMRIIKYLTHPRTFTFNRSVLRDRNR